MTTPHFKDSVALVVTLFLFLLLAQSYTASGAALGDSDSAGVVKKLHSLQIPFIENNGQITDEHVRYYAKTFGGTVFITEAGRIIYSLPKTSKEKGSVLEGRGESRPWRDVRPAAESDQTKGWVIEESFVGASIAAVNGEDTATSKVSYFKGSDPAKWKTGLTTYNQVNLGEIYSGIELKLKAYGNNMEKLFHVKPGADPGTIKIKLDGVGARSRQGGMPLPLEGKGGLSVNDKGELEIETDLGVVKFTKPVAYQEEDGPAEVRRGTARRAPTRTYVEVSYVVEGDEYTFRVGEYDRSKDLVIDPLLASTFIGGSASDGSYSITLDGSGNVYVAGFTGSTDFPTTSGAYDTTYNGPFYGPDAFVAKLSGSLRSLLASTFIGGGGGDEVHSIALDAYGNVYVAGFTSSTDFPTTTGAYDTTYNSGGDVFVARLSGDLTTLLASTFIGGSYDDYGYSIALDGSGTVYVAGYAYSSDFPTTPGAYDTTYNIGGDAFVARLSEGLGSLLASTFVGGGSSSTSIALDAGGNVYLAGWTYSSDFPTTPGAYDTTYSGGYADAFVARLSGDLGSLLASTFVGGSSEDRGYSIALDASGNVYVTGDTVSSTFPTTAGAYDTTSNGSWDVFVARLSGDLTNLLASTFVGGSSEDHALSIALDGSGNVYVGGNTRSSGFPTTAAAHATIYNGGGADAFVARLSGDLTNLLASTFVGGSSEDRGYSIALDASGDVYVAGYTYSSDFPITTGAYDTSYNGGGGYGDAFVTRLDAALSATPAAQGEIWVYPKRHYFGSVEVGDTSDSQAFMLWNIADWYVFMGSLLVTGTDTSQFIIWVDDCSGERISADEICEVSVVFSPTSAGAKSAYLIVPSSDPNAPALSMALTAVGTLFGDIDGDGKLSILDVIHILRKVVGLE